MRTVNVDLGDNSYQVIIGEHILPQLGIYLKQLKLGNKVLIVTNPTVEALYGQTVELSLTDAGFQVARAIIPDGEEYKNLDIASSVYDRAFEAGLDRKSLVLALGGGVVGDLAGFVAATYMRGVPFVQVPTTLLAQVDSSVGGKVAVNHPKGKNIIGAFYQPKLVFADIHTLRTLPEREVKTGLAEVIKYGIIWDSQFFSFLQENAHQVKVLESEALLHIVETSCAIKAKVVATDERETGLRAILNYGHTFGHAIETLTNYQVYRHGEAVAIGMNLAAQLALKEGLIQKDSCDQIIALLNSYSLPTDVRDLDVQEFLACMYHDKKVEGGTIRYVLPEAIGKVRVTGEVVENSVLNLLKERLT